MELSDLRIFRTVVDEGGILAASRRLHRVQSNVSTRIKQLEANLGVRLFVRDGRRLRLSANGKVLLDYAERLLSLADEAKRACTGGPPSGLLRIGALESTSASRLPQVLMRFHERYPDVRIELQTGTNDALTRMVMDGRVDAAFVAERPRDPALASAPAFRERLVLIASRALGPVDRPKRLATDTIIAFPSGCAYRRVLERWLGRHRPPGMRVMELHSYHAIVACVAAGTGIALMPESVLDTVRASGVVRHALPKVLEVATTVLVWRSGECPAPLTALLEQVSMPA